MRSSTVALLVVLGGCAAPSYDVATSQTPSSEPVQVLREDLERSDLRPQVRLRLSRDKVAAEGIPSGVRVVPLSSE